MPCRSVLEVGVREAPEVVLVTRDVAGLARTRFVQLTTFRASGEVLPTPVWEGRPEKT
jgi:hypothetical protein